MTIKTLVATASIIALLFSMFLFAFLKVSFASSLFYNQQSILIERDLHNIPEIHAPHYRAAMYAWGYVTAEDRIFQLTFRRLIGKGILSEYLGQKAIDVDKFFRELNMNGWSLRTVQRMKEKNMTSFEDFQAFADGINDYMGSLHFNPLEYYMLGIKWEEWTVADMFLVFKLLKWSQSQNFADQYIRSSLLKSMSKEEIDLIMPYQEKMWQKSGEFTHHTIIRDQQLSEDLLQQTVPLDSPQFTPVQVSKLVDLGPMEFLDSHTRGSNSWVIGGNLTESGHPILCNDPHLDSAMPAQWHQIRLYYMHEGKQRYLIGGAMAGIPSFVGKTSYASVAITTIYSDIQDLYKQKIEDDKYFFDGKWRNLKIRNETIHVKNSQPIHYIVRQTHHGPIIKHIVSRGYIYKIKEDISLSWTGFCDREYQSVVPYSHLAQVDSFEELKKMLAIYTDYGPPMNILYITKDDHFGYHTVGHYPIRRHPHQGMYVKDGTNKVNEWIGLLQGKKRLHLQDPERGYIVTANNKPIGSKYQNGIFDISMYTGRADRLEKVVKQHLKSGNKFNKQIMKQMQLDTVDGYCEQAMKGINRIIKNKKHDQLFEAMNDFDCNFTKQSKIAPLFLSFYQNVYELKFPPKLDKQYAIAHSFGFLFKLYLFIRDASTDQEIEVLVKAMKRAWEEMEQFFGTRDVNAFRYGELHKDKMIHRPFSQVKSLAPFFQKQSEGWGTQNTPNVAYMSKLHSKDYTCTHRANIRTIISYYEDSEWVVDSGTSEKAYLKHYDDQFQIFMNNEYLLMDPAPNFHPRTANIIETDL